MRIQWRSCFPGTTVTFFARFGAAAVVLAMGACSNQVSGGGDEGSGGASASSTVGAGGGGGDAPTFSDVTGSIIDVHVTDSGDVTNIPDPASVSIAAIWPDGAGGLVTREAAVAADGTFVIPNVRSGTYTLRYEQPPLGLHPWEDSPYKPLYDPKSPFTRYFVTSERTIDLGEQRLGRPDAVRTEVPTPLVLNLDGLAPWQAAPGDVFGSKDELIFANRGGGLWLSSTGFIYWGIEQPADGVTSVSALPLDTRYFIPPRLIQASRGDVLRVTQRVFHEDAAAGELWWAVERAAELSFEQVEGEPLEVSGTLAPLPIKSMSITCDWAAFEALAAGFGPGDTLEGVYAAVLMTPALGFASELTARRCPADGTPATLAYGNPYPGGELLRVSAAYSGGFSSVHGPAEALAGMTLGPALGPPRNLRVNGQALETFSGALGETPVLEYDPPSFGAASGYVVTIFRRLPLSDSEEGITSFYTAETRIEIPPGIVDPAYQYAFLVSARTGWDPEKPLARPLSGATSGMEKTGWIGP